MIMKRMNCRLTVLALLGTLSTFNFAPSLSAAPAAGYETGFQNLTQLSKDLHRALEPNQRKNLFPAPVLVKDQTTPYLQPSKHFTGSNMVAAVYVSPGFVDLMNHLSHALALDSSQKGYLKKYLADVSEQSTSLRNVSHQQTWAFDTMNHQMSFFNQMAGTLIAIDMAHHYLGHYTKYAAKLSESPNVALNSLVTPQEWRKAVMQGSHNALNIGLGVEGIKTLFDAVANMPSRPAWTAYLLPQTANVGKTKKDLDKLEEYFFAGRKFID
jgi:hypothetical protein